MNALHHHERKVICFVLFSLFIQFSVFATRNIKFSVDLSILVGQNKFNPTTDIVYIRGSFNNWGTTTPLTATGNNVYSVTVPLTDNSYQEYKYFINTSGASNGGYETNFPVATSGNRRINISINDLTLPIVYFNDADMDKLKSTEHFNIYYTAYDNADINEFASRLEVCYSNISKAIQSFPTAKTNIYLFKDVDQLHMAMGGPEMADWVVGSAWGSSVITMLSPSKNGLIDALGLFTHEFTHCLINNKAKVAIPPWLHEGVAAYYGKQFSSKDWIKSMMTVKGKPNIADIWSGDASMGYAYSSILAYYIIKTKGEASMAKFIENMNYADIGYANMAALQTEWWAFLDVYLDYQTTINVKFSVDMADMIGAKYFNATTDKVFVNTRGTLSDWSPKQMTLESGTVYSVTLPFNSYNFFEYKFSTNSATAPDSGFELKADETTIGSRLLDVENTNKTLPTVKFNSNAVNGLDMTVINNKINVLKVHSRHLTTPAFSNFKYSFNVLSNTEFNTQKPSDALPFDCGFVAADGTINVSEPTTDAQKAVFKSIDKAAIYYLCQAYIFFYYQTKELPLFFKVGFGAYEAGLDPADATIKTALNNYGGTLNSFEILNNPTTFIANNGWKVAYAFGEFMSVFKNWQYPLIISVNANSFDVVSSWFSTGTVQELLDDFNRYSFARFLESDENLRVKMVLETEHFKFYTRPKDFAINFPDFSNTVESAYSEYTNLLTLKAFEKLTFFTLPADIDASIENTPVKRFTDGTAWSSGIHSTCATEASQLPMFVRMNRHELAHTMQGLMPSGVLTPWTGEGFAGLMEGGPIAQEVLLNPDLQQQARDGMQNVVAFFGHRPTYDETRSFQNIDGFLILGGYFVDFIYRKGGYQAVKDVQMDDLAGYQKMGYSSCQSFLEDFYFDFDVRVQNMKVVKLINPTDTNESTTPSVSINWTPLKADVKLNVAVSTDNGLTWSTISTKTTANSCNWNAGSYVGKFMLKFTAPDNLNVETVYGPFTKVDLEKPLVNFPNGNEYLIAGDTVAITWGNTNIQNYKIEYSATNGSNWNTVISSTPAESKAYNWVIPNSVSSNCKVRISDATNSLKNDESNSNFIIVNPNPVGGPYLFDKNTVLLMHFDNDLKNRSNLSGNGNGVISNITNDNTIPSMLGNCLNAQSPVTVAHNANLNLTGDWTIEAWVKPTSFSSNTEMYILTKPGDSNFYNSNYSLDIAPWWGNTFFPYYFSDANSRIALVGQAVNLNEWYHIAFIRDTKNLELRLLIHDKNRVLISTQSAKYTDTKMLLNTKDLIIGSGLNGYIDEVRISNVVRSFVATGMDRVATKNLFTVCPNPTSGIFKINLSQNTNSPTNIRLLNFNGEIVYNQIVNPRNEIKIDISGMPKGIYLVQIKSNEIYLTQKIVHE